ncbi:uncharacterized protein LOC116261174 [Nymphaea colorata]|nr:uncharacterized protein LOC116261174 [Nymphaea colorata]
MRRNDGYVKNQLQSISDAIDLVPSLATGINVNVRFRNINDFESAPVCVILDLLDIGLVHGWVVDPRVCIQKLQSVQRFETCFMDTKSTHCDTDAATAKGSSSYSTLLEKIVS